MRASNSSRAGVGLEMNSMTEMSVRTNVMAESGARTAAKGLALGVLLAVSFSHLMNDLVQSLIPAIYPILKSSFDLDFGQVGLITFVFQLTASLLQPVVGLYTDRRPMPFSLAIGMGFSLLGLVLLAFAWSFTTLLIAVAFVGCGSSVFHPNLPVWLAWPRAGGMGSRNPSSKSAATPARRSALHSLPSSSCRMASEASPGFPSRR